MRKEYSYKSFYKYKCIFVHIPKCAGVSTCKSLFGNLAGGHTTIKEYQTIFSPKEFREYFKFTIVRNPWDRMVSAFFFLKSGGFDEIDERWAKENLYLYMDFNSFVHRWVNSVNILKYYHFRPQCDFICSENGKLLVDYIGYYENLEEAFSYICEKIGINSKLLRLNIRSNRRKDYKKYYTEEMKQIVADVYKYDIQILGYSFDNFYPKTDFK